MTVSVEVRALSVAYGAQHALRDLTFTLKGGGVYGILGHPGAGKTSLLSVISAYRRASSGIVTIAGVGPFENRDATRLICYIRDDLDICPLTSVRDTLEFTAALRPNWDDGYARALVRRFGLPLGTPVGQLPHPRRSALAVVLGLATRAPLTIFDETFQTMEIGDRYEFYEHLADEQATRPRTFLLSNDRADEVGTLCDELVVLADGRLVTHESVEVLRGSGATVSGRVPDVDRFLRGHTVLSERLTGERKSATVYGALSAGHRAEAERTGLDIGPIGLGDVYAHLTRGWDVSR